MDEGDCQAMQLPTDMRCEAMCWWDARGVGGGGGGGESWGSGRSSWNLAVASIVLPHWWAETTAAACGGVVFLGLPLR